MISYLLSYLQLAKDNHMYEHYKDAFTRYADFEGRTSLQAFWYFILGHFIVFAGLLTSLIISIDGNNDVMAGIVGISMGLYVLASIIPIVAASARRLRDSGRSPYLLLLNFVPFGVIVLLVLLAQRGQSTDALELNDSTLGFSSHEEPLALPQLDIDEEYV